MFFDDLDTFSDNLAAKDAYNELTYAQLASKCRQFQALLSEGEGEGKRVLSKSLFILKCANNIGSLIAYLGLLRAGHSIILMDQDVSDANLQHNIKLFAARASIEIRDSIEPVVIYNLSAIESSEIDPSLALLLSTSGSTGSAKHVALSYQNLHANAASICQYLPIQQNDRTLCSLPMFYSYGLSVINSHLFSGACCVLSDFSPVNRGFWQLLEGANITSIAGVPYTYEMLLRLRFTSKKLPSLRYFTQAGGKLAPERIVTLSDYAKQHNKQFFVMYGQTEATARMSFLDPDKSVDKPDSIGKAIPGGTLTLVDQNGKCIDQPNSQGELVYAGPNVMMGYANNGADLNAFSKKQQLLTGDLAYFDQLGDFFITGRRSRFIKLFGNRIGLDQVEQRLSDAGLKAYACGNDQALVIAVDKSSVNNQTTETDIKTSLSEWLSLHYSVIKVHQFDQLPINANGKRDYQAIMKILDQVQ